MAEGQVVPMPESRQSLPEQIDVDPSAMPPHTPRETSLLKAMTGHSLAELIEDAPATPSGCWSGSRCAGWGSTRPGRRPATCW